MYRLLLLFLIALAALNVAGVCTQEQEPAPITCLQVRQHVNAVYERDMRGEIVLSPDAIAQLHWLDRSLCAQAGEARE